MVLCLFNLDLEEEFQRIRELGTNLLRGLLHHTEENILVRVVRTLIVMGDHIEIEGPPERERYQGQNGRPPDRRNYQDRGYSERGYTNQSGRPPE